MMNYNVNITSSRHVNLVMRKATGGTFFTARDSRSGKSRPSVFTRWSRPPRMRSRVSEKGRDRSTASCARRTLAAATSFMAEVIFRVFFVVAMRDRSSRMEAPGLERRNPGRSTNKKNNSSNAVFIEMRL